MKEFNIEIVKNGRVETLLNVAEHNVATQVAWFTQKRGYKLVQIVEVAPMGDVTQNGMFGCD